jgi:hypothetical protein
MTWYEDLRHIEWNSQKFTVLDKIKEEGRVYLGLAPFEEIAQVAEAMNAGTRRPLPTSLVWVEESSVGFHLLPKSEVARLQARKSARAVEAFRKP